MRIFKYMVPLGGSGDLELAFPKGARFLTLQVQGRDPCIWALVDPDAAPQLRRLQWIGTGHDASSLDDAHYLGTVQTGPYVFHLFDRDGKW
jgi:hypothetical protein